MGKEGPKPIDVKEVAGQQTDANKAAQADTILGNLVNREGPFGGTSTFGDFNAETGLPGTLSTSLGPQFQPLATALAGNANELSQFLPTSAPEVSDTSGIAKAIFDQGISLNQGQLDRDRKRLEIDTFNRGLRPGGEAFQFAIDPLNEREDKFRLDLARQAQIGGEDARSRAIANAGAEQSLAPGSIANILGLIGGIPGVTPANQPSAGVNPADVIGLTNQRQQQLQANAESQNALLGSGLATAAGLIAAPFTGGASLGLAAGGLSGLFGGGGGAETNFNPFSNSQLSPSVSGFSGGGGFGGFFA